jgi:hypothetical protein
VATQEEAVQGKHALFTVGAGAAAAYSRVSAASTSRLAASSVSSPTLSKPGARLAMAEASGEGQR